MLFSGLSLILSLFLLLQYLPISKAQDPVLDLYINNRAISSSLNGTRENPYLQLSDAFEAIKDTSSPMSQISLHIASSSVPYNLNGSEYFIDNHKTTSLSFIQWTENSSNNNEVLIPVLSLDASSLVLSDLDLFSIQGINILGGEASLIISNTTVILQDLDIDVVNSEYGQSMINIKAGTDVTFENVNIHQQSPGCLLNYLSIAVVKSYDVLLQNVTIILGETTEKNSSELLVFSSNTDNPVGNMTIINLKVLSQNGTSNILPALLKAEGFHSVLISNFSIYNESLDIKAQKSIITLEHNTNVEFNGLVLSNNKMNISSAEAFIFIRETVNLTVQNIDFSNNYIVTSQETDSSLFNTFNVKSINLLDQSIYQNSFDLLNFCFFSTNKFDAYAGLQTAENMSLIIDSIYIFENNGSLYKNSLTYLDLQEASLETFTVINIEYSRNSLSGQIFSLQPDPPSKRTTFDPSVSPKTIALSNVSILDNTNTSNMTFLYFNPSYDQQEKYGCLQPAEAFAIYIDNLTVVNNSYSMNDDDIYPGSLFQVIQAQFHLNNSSISNNSFYRYSLIMFGTKASTAIITSSEFIGNNITLSQLVMDSGSSGYTCTYIGGSSTKTQTALYRYTFILNSTFMNNNLNSSVMFNTVTGFIALHDNKLTNEYINNSQFIIMPSLQSQSGYSLAKAYSRNEIIERSTLQNNKLASSLFEETMTIALLHQISTVYFTSIYNNTFTNTTCKSLALFSFNALIDDQTFTRIEENKFLSINFLTFDISLLLHFSNPNTVVVIKNVFEDIQGQGGLFSLDQDNGFSSLQVDSNLLRSSSICSFLTSTANSIKTVEFSNNVIADTTISINLLSINAKTTSGDWIFDNNTISNNLFISDTLASEESVIDLIILSCSDASSSNQVLFSNSLLENMTASFGEQTNISLFMLETFQKVKFENVTMDSVNITGSGTFIQATTLASFSLKNSRISNITTNSPNELISLSALEVLLQNSIMEACIHQDYLSSLFVVEVPFHGVTFEIENCQFNHITGGYYSNVLTTNSLKPSVTQETQEDSSLYRLELKIFNSSFKDVDKAISLSSITCKECIIRNVDFTINEWGGLITFKSDVSGDLTMENIKLKVAEDLHRDCFPIIEISGSTITVIVDKVESIDQGYLYLVRQDSGTLTIKNSLFSNVQILDFPFINIAQQVNSILKEPPTNTPITILQNITFMNFNSSRGVLAFDVNQIIWPEAQWDLFCSETKAIVSVLLPAYVTVQQCKFKNINSLAAIYYEVASQSSNGMFSTFQIQDSIFQDISFTMGPALTILPKVGGSYASINIDVSITNSTFEGNRADIGGALFIFNSSLNIADSDFRNNSATIAGDHLYLGGNSEDKNMTNCLFEDILNVTNKRIAYEPINFNITFVIDDLNSIQLEPVIYNTFWEMSLKNMSSLEVSQGYLRFDFIDYYGDSAWDFSNSRSGSFIVEDNSDYNLSTNFDALIPSSDGGISLNVLLSNLVIAGKADNETELVLLYSSTRFDNILSFKITLRSCLPGEYNNSVMCLPCAENTFSFDPSQPCAKCPPNANCRAQSQICPTLGFWNSRTNSTTLHQCHPGRCLNDQDCITCASGYAGPLCNACDFNSSYVEKGYLKCGKCQDPQISLVLTILAALLYFAYQLFSIHVLYTGDRKIPKVNTEFLTLRKLERSYYIKSLLTYTQLMSTLYLSSYELYNSLGLTLHFGNPSVLITYGTQCSLTALGVQSADFLYYQTYFQVLYPIIQFAVISLFFVLAKLVWRSLKCKRLITITALYLIISNQTGIVNSLGLFLSCGTLDDLGYSFVTAHPNWSCDTDQYTSFAQVFVMPSLVLWCGVIPISLLLILYVDRRSLFTKESKGSFGILLSGLRSRYYFWGILLMALKLALSFLIVSLQQKSQTRIFLSLVLLWAYQSLVRALQPYDNPSFNRFQIILMNLLMFNIIVTQYLIDPSNGQTLSEICVVICAIGNGSVVLYMCWKVVSLTFLRVVAFVEKKVMKRKVEKDSLLISGVKRRDTLIEANGVN